MATIAQREVLLTKEQDLLTELKHIETDIVERKKEIVRIREQVKYYTKLVRDMKREMKPSSFKDMVRGI